jgi:hypothetical protein
VNAFRPLLVAGALGLAGCSLGCGDASSGTPAAPSAPAAAAPVPSGFGDTDLAWLEINIAMDEQLQPLLDLVPTRSRDAGVKALAVQVKAFTSAELSTLRHLHDQAGLPAANPHEGMPMPGMVAPAQVTSASALTGPAFDRAVVPQIKAHLVQSQSLAHSEEKAGVEPQTRGLALEVLKTREQALSTLPKAP